MSSNTQNKAIPAPARRERTSTAINPNLTSEERQEKQEEVINNAPLRSNEADHTNPAPAEHTAAKRKPKVKPWRVGFEGMPVETLMQIQKKTSFTQVQEIDLRLAHILNDRNLKRGFGKKVYLNDLILEALDRYTTEELKQMGFDDLS